MTAPTGRASPEPAAADPVRFVDAHRHARAYYRDHLLRADGPRRYLASRGLATLAKVGGDGGPWYVGYAPPGWTSLANHLTKAGYTPAELIAAGLATRSRTGNLVDRFRDRIMFPIHHPDGHPVAFIGRAAPSAAADVPKYLNTPDTAIYHKGQTLYGAGEQADRIAAGAAPTLVEGPVDVLAVALTHPDGDRIAVAACGTSLTTNHAAAIAAMPGAALHGVTAALDNDDAGRMATHRAWPLLSAHPGINLYAATLPDHTDPGDLTTRASDIAVLRAAFTDQRPLAQAVIDVRLDALTEHQPDLLRWLEGRVSAARTLARLITNLPADQIVTLTGYIAMRTNLGFDTVARTVLTHLERSPPPMPPTSDLGQRSKTFPPASAPPGNPRPLQHAVHDRHLSRRTR